MKLFLVSMHFFEYLRRNCELVITIGYNIYTTSVEIRPPSMAYIKRRSNWHNRYAYYAAGAFRGNNDNAEVELI